MKKILSVFGILLAITMLVFIHASIVYVCFLVAYIAVVVGRLMESIKATLP